MTTFSSLPSEASPSIIRRASASKPEMAAAIRLCRGLLNRHPGSSLEAEFRGREALLVSEIADAIRDVRSVALRTGRLDETIELLIRLFAGDTHPQ